jgi:exonuclease III
MELRSGRSLACSRVAPQPSPPLLPSKICENLKSLVSKKANEEEKKSINSTAFGEAKRLCTEPACTTLRCRLGLGNGQVCRRKFFNFHSLKGIARQILPQQRMAVTWTDGVSTETWHGQRLPNGKAKYEESNMKWPFPPEDRTIRISQVKVEHRPSRFTPDIWKEVWRAKVGDRVRTRTKKRNREETHNGVVTAKKGPLCLVKWFPGAFSTWFPPPPGREIVTLKVFSGSIRWSSYPAEPSANAEALSDKEAPTGTSATRSDDRGPTIEAKSEIKDSKGRKRTKIATLNCRSAKREGKMQVLCAHCAQNRVDAIVLTETKRRQQQDHHMEGWTVTETDGDNKGNSGVAVLSAPGLEVTKSEIIVEHRAISVHMPHITIIAIYAPTCQRQRDQEDFYNRVAEYTSKIPGTTPVIIAGDFNARPLATAKGPLQRASAIRLRDFLAQTGFTGANRNMIPTHAAGGTLDYIFVRKRFASSIFSQRVSRPPIRSDHKMVTAEIFVKWRVKKCEDTPAKQRDYSAANAHQEFLRVARLPPGLAAIASIVTGNSIFSKLPQAYSPSYAQLVAAMNIAATTLPFKEKLLKAKSWNTPTVTSCYRTTPIQNGYARRL